MPRDKNIKYASRRRKKPLILLTNDDGINAKGIAALENALKSFADLLIVAPSVEQSAMSHSLSLRKPLKCEELSPVKFAVGGTPTDCVNLAVNFILKGDRPDLLVSGINHGPNLGDDIHYSGTVSAALEGGLFGIPSIAVSSVPISSHFEFSAAASFAREMAKIVLKKGFQKDVILNINVPSLTADKINGVEITFQGQKHYSDVTHVKYDSNGDKFYLISGDEAGHEDLPGSDCNAIHMGKISITPIRIDMTHKQFMDRLKKWGLQNVKA
ncbi:MAG: 5'/3'-nucleotidase SurE [Deltaproteobacteria bacterium]|nr:5'/3'-nucleotidase SurE [Deltaproteobacteria bacterium]